MIEVTAGAAFMIYLGLTLAVLLGMWTYQHFKNRLKKTISSDCELFVCEYCHFVYMNKSETELTKCPQCQSFNQNNQYKKTLKE